MVLLSWSIDTWFLCNNLSISWLIFIKFYNKVLGYKPEKEGWTVFILRVIVPTMALKKHMSAVNDIVSQYSIPQWSDLD